MENIEENNQIKDNLLEPPPFGNSYIEDEDEKSSIKSRFSPLPRRRSSVSSDEGDLEPPTTVARKVSFADAFGFDLVSVKEFDTWEVPIVSQILSYEMETHYIEEFYLTASFTLPSSDDIMGKLHAKKVLLESIELTPGTSSMKGIIRVLNVSYEKQIYVRMSMDDWQSYYDLTAEYIPYSFKADTDQFAFTISLVAPYQKEGASVQFCISYETPIGTFWDNNDGKNYRLICHKKECAVEKDHPSEDLAEKFKKSCLKSTPSKEEDDLDESEEKYSRSTDKYIPRIICSQDENTEDNNNEEDDSQENNREADEDLELLLNQNLMKARIISTEDNKSIKTQIFEEPRLPNTIQTCESLECLRDSSTDIFKKINDNDSAKESREFNENELCLTLNDSPKTLIAEDIKSTSLTEQHLKKAGISLQEDLPQNGGDLKQKKGLTIDSQDDTSVLQGKEERKWSLTTNRNQEPYNEIETTLSPKTESVQLTDNLDDNANPNNSINIVDSSYFSIYNKERMKDENNQFPENKKINRCFFNKAESSQLEQDYSTISLNQKYTSPGVSEDPDKISPEDEHEQPSLDAAHDCKIFKNTVSLENLTISDQVAFSCLDNQGQIKGINDEKTSKAKSVTTTFSFPCDTTDATSNQGSLEVLFENKITKKEIDAYTNDSQSEHLQKSKQCYTSTFNVSEESQIFEWPLITSNAPLTSQNQDDNRDKARVVDTPDLKIRSKLDFPVHTTDRADSTENQLTMGEKVIIALVTEETSESEISIPVPYIDVCTEVGKNIVDKTDIKIGIESESQKVTYNLNKGGGRNKEREEINTPLDDMKVLSSIERDGDNGQMQRTTTSEMPGADEMYMGAYNVFKDQFKRHLDDFSNNITTVAESDSQMTDNSHTESSNSLCAELSGNFSKLVKEQGDTIDNIIISGSTTDMSGMLHAQENTEQNYFRPSILISEPDDELERWCIQDEEKSEPEDMNQCYYYSETNHQTQTGDHETEDDSLSSDPLNFSTASSKVICSVMFVVFSGLMYHYDFLVCFALYLFSLYWLYWERDGNKKSVRKE